MTAGQNALRGSGPDQRRDVSVVDQPLEVGARTVGRIAGEPFRLKTEAFLGALDPDASRQFVLVYYR